MSSKTLLRNVVLRHHLVMEHSIEKPYSCEYCNRRFSQKCNMQRHAMMHTGKRPFRCTVCSKGFTQKGNLERHFNTHTGNKPYACNVCNKTFTQNANLKTHLLRHTGDRPFKCDLCGKAFAVKGNLHVHLLRHADDTCYICEVCNEGFLAEDEYTQHMLTHEIKQVFGCEVCLEKFESEVEVKKHMSIHRPRDNKLRDENNLLQSTELTASRVYDSEASSEKLTRKGGTKDPFAPGIPAHHVCVACGKRYTQKYNLNRHLRVHMGEHYICNVCGDGIKHRSNFKRHLSLHSEDAPYKCGLCSKGFYQKSNLQRHLATHNNTHLKEHEGDLSENGHVKEGDDLTRTENLSRNVYDCIKTEYADHSPSYVSNGTTDEDNQSASDNVKIYEDELVPTNEILLNELGCSDARSSNDMYEDGQTPKDDTLYVQTNASELSSDDAILCVTAPQGDVTSDVEVYARYDGRQLASDSCFVCDQCGEAFPDHCLFRSHLWTHSDDPIIVVVV